MHETKKRILVVDDNPHIRAIIEVFVRDRGYDGTMASSGRQALEETKKNRFDLVLLDIRLPDITGYDVAKKMQADSENHDMPVVGMSADFSKEDQEKASASGMKELIYKEDLVSDLRRLIEQYARPESYAA